MAAYQRIENRLKSKEVFIRLRSFASFASHSRDKSPRSRVVKVL